MEDSISIFSQGGKKIRSSFYEMQESATLVEKPDEVGEEARFPKQPQK